MQRRLAWVMAITIVAAWVPCAGAREKSIEELPQDVWTLAFMWTEPIKGVVRESRRFDPVSGLWFGLLEGSITSVERTANFFLPSEETQQGTNQKSGKPLLRYSF